MHEEYMQELRKWLQETEDVPLEEMSAFFVKRLHDYEEHMSIWDKDLVPFWEKSYQEFAKVLPSDSRQIMNGHG